MVLKLKIKFILTNNAKRGGGGGRGFPGLSSNKGFFFFSDLALNSNFIATHRVFEKYMP
jgi:hypothetical protein